MLSLKLVSRLLECKEDDEMTCLLHSIILLNKLNRFSNDDFLADNFLYSYSSLSVKPDFSLSTAIYSFSLSISPSTAGLVPKTSESLVNAVYLLRNSKRESILLTSSLLTENIFFSCASPNSLKPSF